MSDPANLPLRLSLDEAVLLMVGLKLLDEMVEAIEINGQAQEALMTGLMSKLQRTLPGDLLEMTDQIVEDIVTATLNDGEGSDLDVMTADSSYALPMYAIDGVMPVIEQAIEEERSLDVSYYSMSREEFSVRRIDPYGLKRVGDLHWLIAYCHLREDRRVFRVDRFKTATLSESRFKPPVDFHIGEYFDDIDP